MLAIHYIADMQTDCSLAPLMWMTSALGIGAKLFACFSNGSLRDKADKVLSDVLATARRIGQDALEEGEASA